MCDDKKKVTEELLRKVEEGTKKKEPDTKKTEVKIHFWEGYQNDFKHIDRSHISWWNVYIRTDLEALKSRSNRAHLLGNTEPINAHSPGLIKISFKISLYGYLNSLKCPQVH